MLYILFYLFLNTWNLKYNIKWWWDLTQRLFLMLHLPLSQLSGWAGSHWCHHCPVINNTWDTSWDTGSDCGWPRPSRHHIISDTVCVIPFPSFLILVPIRVRRGPVVLIPGTHFPLYGLGWDGWTHVILPPPGLGDTHSMLCQRVAQTTLSLTSAILADKLSPLLLKS